MPPAARLPDLESIKSFLLLAEGLNFRRAALALNLDQSALSRRIAALEALLGVALFRRTTREVRLTEAGQAFYDANLPLLAAVRDAVMAAQRVATGTAGRLRVGYMSFAATEAMPEPVRRFRESFPDVAIELIYQPTQMLKQSVLRRHLDAGFVIGPANHPDLQTRPVLEERLVAVIPATHPLAKAETVTLQDLANTPMILGSMTEWEAYRDILQTLFDQSALTLRAAFEASSAIGMIGLVAAGLGVTIYPEGIKRLSPEGVVFRDIAECPTRVQTALIWPRAGVSSATRNFLLVCGAPANQIAAA